MKYIYGLKKSGLSLIAYLNSINEEYLCWDDDQATREELIKFNTITNIIDPNKLHVGANEFKDLLGDDAKFNASKMVGIFEGADVMKSIVPSTIKLGSCVCKTSMTASTAVSASITLDASTFTSILTVISAEGSIDSIEILSAVISKSSRCVSLIIEDKDSASSLVMT